MSTGPWAVVVDLLTTMAGWLVGPYALAFTMLALVMLVTLIAYDSGLEVGADDVDGSILITERTENIGVAS